MKAFVEWCKQTFGAPPIIIEAVPTIRALLVTIVGTLARMGHARAIAEFADKLYDVYIEELKKEGLIR
jgi:hypothetical protein